MNAEPLIERLTERSRALLAETPCPSCGQAGLSIDLRLQCKPIGTFSLAGAGLKFSATERPVLSCTHCDWSRDGVQIGDDLRFGT